MKLQTIILAISFLLVGTVSFAGNGESIFRKKVNSKIKYPEQMSEKSEAEVFVVFTVMETGELRIDSISSENEELNKSVAEQLKSIKIGYREQEVIGQTFRYKFVMKVQ